MSGNDWKFFLDSNGMSIYFGHISGIGITAEHLANRVHRCFRTISTFHVLCLHQLQCPTVTTSERRLYYDRAGILVVNYNAHPLLIKTLSYPEHVLENPVLQES